MATSSTRGVDSHSRATVVSSETPSGVAAGADDSSGEVPRLRQQITTSQRRLAPIDKRHKNNRATRKRCSDRRPEATEMTSQRGGQDSVVGNGGGGGPKFRATSGARRGRLRPLLTRRSRMCMAELMAAVPPAAEPEDKLPNNSGTTEGRPQIPERGTTFTSSVTVPDVSVEACRPPSPLQLQHLPLSLSASTSGSELDLMSPPSKSSDCAGATMLP